MAATLQLARNTHVFMKVGTNNYWKLPVLDGFSFSQATATQDLALNEMSDTSGSSNRGRTMFTNALEPAEWSFSMYARPTLLSTTHSAVEEALWAMFFGADTYSAGAWSRAALPVTSSPVAVSRTPSTNMTVTSANSNVATLGEFELFFVFGGCTSGADAATYSQANGQTIYKMTKCVVNTASIDFDIDGITTINWSGFGAVLSQETSMDNVSTAISTGLASTSNYLRNRVTSLSVKPNDRFAGASITTAGASDDLDQDQDAADDFAAAYSVTLTGGTINFENNITFLTPDELCKVNAPIGHVTGNRSIGGNFTCYLNDDGDKSAKLFNDLASATNLSQNGFELVFTIGGGTSGSITIDMPVCHIETPVHQIEDIISLETTFHALPSTMTGHDDATLTYVGVI